MSDKSAAKKFLIVDDSAVERTLLRGLLKQNWPTCEVLEAEDGAEGIRAVEEGMPDLVLTDVCMPGSGGLELLAALREKQSIVPVVAMSVMGNEEVAVAALQAGAASYLPKLKMPQLLASTINMVSELSATHRNRRRIIGCLNSIATTLRWSHRLCDIWKTTSDRCGCAMSTNSFASAWPCMSHCRTRSTTGIWNSIPNCVRKTSASTTNSPNHAN